MDLCAYGVRMSRRAALALVVVGLAICSVSCAAGRPELSAALDDAAVVGGAKIVTETYDVDDPVAGT